MSEKDILRSLPFEITCAAKISRIDERRMPELRELHLPSTKAMQAQHVCSFSFYSI